MIFDDRIPIPPQPLISMPVTLGELLDRVAILAVKTLHCKTNQQKESVYHLRQALIKLIEANPHFMAIYSDCPEYDELLTIHRNLWRIEEEARQQERVPLTLSLTYSAILEYIGEAAGYRSSVTRLNDRRAAIKSYLSKLVGHDKEQEPKIY